MDEVKDLSEALPAAQSVETVHVEVCQSTHSVAASSDIKQHVVDYLVGKSIKFGDIYTDFNDNEYLSDNIECITICDKDDDICAANCVIDKSKVNASIYIFQLHHGGAESEEIEEDELSAANHWILPAAEFQGLWENLIYDMDVKQQLLNYSSSTLLFSDKKVDPNIISWNRVILLHGPPGTGKTSLCKALAQKLTIRFSERFRYGQLIEINSHSLFSKWFSESGKLVMKMFQRIQELIDDPDALVCVLIDEVESLTAARTAAMKGTEPSDAIRVVNALLTQIDQIKRYPNVLILTTSNITGAIDLAFVDRADIKQYIGPPTEQAIFTIYHSCITELKKKQIVQRSNLPDLRTLKMMRFQENGANSISFRLLEIARKSYGLSGRTLRKLPFLAYSMYIQNYPVSQEAYLDALSRAVDKQLDDRDKLTSERRQQLDLPIEKNIKKRTESVDTPVTNGIDC